MDKATIERLNGINRVFYATVADEFDTTRGKAWPGWKQLLPSIRQHLRSPLRALDVGCGNGRFGVFLRESLPEWTIQYHGMDNSESLLAHAGESLNGLAQMDITLETRDIVENPPDTGEYELVVLFGVMHHIPGATQRLAMMQSLAGRVASGGMLAFACWRFFEYPRFRERITPWPDDIAVEAGDYLLDWRRGETALRYCHYVDDAEHAALVAAAGLREISIYRADGQTGDANRYTLFLKS